MKITFTRFIIGLLAILLMLTPITKADTEMLFTDNFEGNLDGWEIFSTPDVVIRSSNDPSHDKVLVLIPNGDVYALVRGSDRWKGIRMQGDVLFPKDESNYLGIIYNFRTVGGRTDFGNIYIKGDGSYLQANPHWDFNVGRTLYPEFHVNLSGTAAIRIGEWQHFKVEVIKNECHFYVGDMSTPQLTYPLRSLKTSGHFGLQPRSVGGEVWVDNIVVDSIKTFTYKGPSRPAISYETESLLTRWEVLGPLERNKDDVPRNTDAKGNSWRSFATDERGAVITAMVTDYQGPRTVAYFRTRFEHGKDEELFLHISTVDDLAVWVNGRFQWFIPRDENAWFDFRKKPEHAGQRIPIPIRKGENQIVVRARGGVYASGGFYACLETPK
ncbi:hypothetical protein L0222_11185 [bacterium]|nr:hypothetical protein [bacterium]